MTKPKNNGGNASLQERTYLFCTSVISKVGVSGFLIITGTIFLFFYTTQDQKHELFDKWILLKGNNYCEQMHFLVVSVAIVILIVKSYAFSRMRQLDRDEIDRLRKLMNFPS